MGQRAGRGPAGSRCAGALQRARRGHPPELPPRLPRTRRREPAAGNPLPGRAWSGPEHPLKYSAAPDDAGSGALHGVAWPCSGAFDAERKGRQSDLRIVHFSSSIDSLWAAIIGGLLSAQPRVTR